MEWWHWALVGFGGILAELLLPAFVLVWFGLAALIVMLLVLVVSDIDLAVQLFIWAVLSIGMVFAWFKFFKQGHHKILIGRASAHLIGEVGMVIEPVAPFQNGKVRFQKPLLGSDQWECIAEEKIAVGERVKVVSIDGSRVTVAKV